MNSKTGIKMHRSEWILSHVGNMSGQENAKDSFSQKFADASEQDRSNNRNGKGTGPIPGQSTD